MKIKTLILTICICFANNIEAEAYFCPGISSLKEGDYKNWIAMNSRIDRIATIEEIQRFRREITHFQEADWSRYFIHGFGQCYYDSTEVHLVSSDLPLFARPIGPNWAWDNLVAHCVSINPEECQF